MVVTHDQQPGRTRRPDRRPGLVHEREEQFVGGPPTGVSDDEPGRDALVAHATVRNAIEDEFDTDRGRHDRP